MANLPDQPWTVTIIGGLDGLDSTAHNVDVEVAFADGSRFVATFFTVRNIEHLCAKNRRTGECAAGLYLWATDMIIVPDYAMAIFEQTIQSLLTTGEFAQAFSRLED